MATAAVVAQQAGFSSYPDTFTLVALMKTPIMANPGCFSWTRQALNYCPHREGCLLGSTFREYLSQ